MNDIVINKVQSIQRCILRAREERHLAGPDFATDYSRQDAAILNIMRACEQAIDLANYVIKTYKMGVPASSAESFELLADQAVIPPALARNLRGMIGFRNIAVHQYQRLDLAIMETIIAVGLDDLLRFGDAVWVYLQSSNPSGTG